MLRQIEEDTAGNLVTGYRILGKLGEGGMGTVFKAVQLQLDRIVALKVVSVGRAGDRRHALRFEREAHAIASLNHPNIVSAYDYGEDDGRVFLALEYVEGMNCEEALERHGPFPETTALAVIREAAHGLAHAAATGIIHRDVKPGNLLLSTTTDAAGRLAFGAVKVADLGLATFAHGVEKARSELTIAGGILGSPHYMSIEQARGDEVDFRTDVYGLGATLYHLVTGRMPFQAGTVLGVLSKKECERLEHPQDLIAGLGDGLVRVLDRMMARSPEARYGSYDELLTDLDLLLAGRRPATDPVDPAESSLLPPGDDSARRPRATALPIAGLGPIDRRRRSSLPLALGAAGVAVALAVGLATILSPDARPAPSETEPADPGPARAERLAAALDGLAGLEDDALLARLEEHSDALGSDLDALEPTERIALEADFDQLVDRALAAHAARRLPDLARLHEDQDYEALARAIVEVALPYDRLGRPEPEALGDFRRVVEAARIDDRGLAEAAAWRAAATEDPIARAEILAGFETRFPFSRHLDEAIAMRRAAEAAAPHRSIETRPPGASLSLDGRSLGAAPWSGRLRRGTYRLAAGSPGHFPLEAPLAHEADGRTVLRLDPAPARPLTIDSAAGVPVWMGSLRGWKTTGEWTAQTDLGGLDGTGAGDSRSHALRDLGTRFASPPMEGAGGWQLTFEMGPISGRPRAELWLLAASDGAVLVVGVEGRQGYVGQRGPAPERTLEVLSARPLPVDKDGLFPLTLAWHGDVLVASNADHRIGSVRAGPDPVASVLEFVVDGEGTARFLNLDLRPMR